MRISWWSIHVWWDASMGTIAGDRQEVVVGACLRLYEPWSCTLSTSEVLVATDLYNHD